jgi:hypothetical protein
MIINNDFFKQKKKKREKNYCDINIETLKNNTGEPR